MPDRPSPSRLDCDLSSIIAERLNAARRTRRLTQVALARKANLPASSISHFESGNRKPSIENLDRLADALDVSVDHLIGRSPAHAPHTRLQHDLAHLSDAQLDVIQRLVAVLADVNEVDHARGRAPNP